MRLLAGIISLSLSSVCWAHVFQSAGGDSSGGGEIVRHQWNPWFIQNTSDINYCIEQGADFLQTESELDAFVQRAANYWKLEFARARRYDGGMPRPVQIATQRFVKVDCNDEPSIRFQFGVITDEQKALIGDPRDYVAIVARTEYDPTYLRSKGFIYVSPDNGPNRYRGDEYIDGAWSIGVGSRLMFVLLHELGHIFGVSHSGDARNIMGASFPDSLVKSSNPTYFDNIRYQPEYFTYSVEQHPMTCTIPSQAKRVLGLTEPCLKVELLDFDVRIFAGDQSSNTWRLVGSSDFVGGDGGLMAYTNYPTVYVTSQNQVIDLNGNVHATFDGQMIRNKTWRGRFEFSNSRRHLPMTLEMEPNRLRISAPEDGWMNIILDLYKYPMSSN